MIPEIPLSLYPVTSNPTMLQHPPIVAAAAAVALKSIIIDKAALDIVLDIVILSKQVSNLLVNIGCCSVLIWIQFPKCFIYASINGAINFAIQTPTNNVKIGDKIISILVFPEYTFPNSLAKTEDK